MKRTFARRWRGVRWRHLLWMLSVLVCIFAVILFAFFGCRPIIMAFAESQALWIATKTANRIVAEVLTQYADSCSNAISVAYKDEQTVSAIQTNTSVVNTVRTAIMDAVMTAIEQISTVSVPIPVGTLSGVHWLSGWGPLLTFPMSFTATVLSDVSSSLVAVGINQSSYRVLVHLDVSLYVVTPGGHSTVGTRMSYPVAEAVLLGDVPDNITEVYGDDQSLLGQIFDYGAGQ